MKIKSFIFHTFEFLIGICILSGTLYLYLNQEVSNTRNKRPSVDPMVRIAPTKLMKINLSIEGIGTGFAKESVNITSNVTEKVVGVFFEDGQYVKKDDVLIQLNDAQYQAELVQAEVDLEEQEREFLRISKLSESRTVSSKEYTGGQTAVAKAQTVIDIVQYQIDNRRIVAPFDGKLGMRNVGIGDLVSPGKIITTLDDISEIKVEFQVSEKYFYQLHNGLPVQLTSYAYPGSIFSGTITAVSPRLDPQTRMMTVRATINNESRKLAPGMLFVAHLNLGKYTAIMVPEKAIMSIGEMQYVFTYDEKTQTVKRIKVVLGMRSAGNVEIQKGLKQGMPIVVDGVLKLVDGCKVRLEAPKENKSNNKVTEKNKEDKEEKGDKK